MKVIDEKDFESEISSGVVLVDFFASWCAPCRAMGSILEQIDGQIEGAKIIKVDVDQSGNVARQFGIMSIPTLIIFKDGEIQEKHIGLWQKTDCEEAIKKYL